MRIYIASSWRNHQQQEAVRRFRELGHTVYDFRNAETAFGWDEIDSDWRGWSGRQFRDALQSPLCRTGFVSDMTALECCDLCLLLLPCGRSAHLELGWAIGAGKKTAIVLDDHPEPELTYRIAGKLYACLNEAATDIGHAAATLTPREAAEAAATGEKE